MLKIAPVEIKLALRRSYVQKLNQSMLRGTLIQVA